MFQKLVTLLLRLGPANDNVRGLTLPADGAGDLSGSCRWDGDEHEIDAPASPDEEDE